MRQAPVFILSETERRFSAGNAGRFELDVVWGIDLGNDRHVGVDRKVGEASEETHGLAPLQWRGRL